MNFLENGFNWKFVFLHDPISSDDKNLGVFSSCSSCFAWRKFRLQMSRVSKYVYWTDAARDAWDTENYIYFDTALYRFQFHRKKYVSLMSLKNEDYKEQLVEGILRGER